MFYIYCYYEVDYNNPIYIGKGKDDRLWNHFETYELYKNDMFHKKLRSMLLNDIPILVKKLFENLEEDVALELEILLIKKYGRRDIGTGCLFNGTDGGEGLSGNHSSRGIWTSKTYISRIMMVDSKKISRETIEKITKSVHKIHSQPIESYNLITGETVKRYDSIKQTLKDGFVRSSIYNVLRGRYKEHYGLGWRHAN